ncbi:hypothetical protein RBSWK_03392 [Rhodopirellula baltica SWK14]|uniref:Uncharacterized protein n=1 Tax=Rhodopirellula baltica SWK14 TaxID=993516 RepID=L7CEM2_RHOBT|nr:hypothetical protein RBSWK_03392 [Rhodopirellula baltica SWK14]
MQCQVGRPKSKRQVSQIGFGMEHGLVSIWHTAMAVVTMVTQDIANF